MVAPGVKYHSFGSGVDCFEIGRCVKQSVVVVVAAVGCVCERRKNLKEIFVSN